MGRRTTGEKYFDRHFPGIVLEEPRETTISVKGKCARDEIKEHG
jgi:hypothetical protein